MGNFARLNFAALVQSWQERYSQGWRHRQTSVFLIVGGITLAVSTTAVISYQIVRGLILDNLKQNAFSKKLTGQ